LKKQKLTYVISDIDKALAFEWIAMQISKEEYDLSFILLNPSSSDLERFLSANHFEVKHIKCAGKKDWPMAWLRVTGHLLRIKPDIVHCHLLQANILGLTAAKFVGVRKRIYTRHHSDYHFRYFPNGVKWDKMANSLATHIVAPSKGVQQILVERELVAESKVHIINHGFDLDYFRNVSSETKIKIRDKYNIENKYPVVGVISRFTELKGIQYIIPAYNRLLMRYPDALLLLFNANGDYVNVLNQQLYQLPKNSYKAIAFESELAAVYNLFDVFVQASTDTLIEAFGQTYVEALAAGVPSIFTLSGIAPDFIQDHQNAIVVPFKDENAIYEGMLEILTSIELRNKIINEGWNSVQNRFSLHKMMIDLTKLYRV
jgi:glycosyltransferase involved in cell wall biosynthesis